MYTRGLPGKLHRFPSSMTLLRPHEMCSVEQSCPSDNVEDSVIFVRMQLFVLLEGRVSRSPTVKSD